MTHDTEDTGTVSEEEMQALFADLQEDVIEQYVEGFKRMGCVLPQYRSLADQDEDVAEAIKRYETP